MLRQKQRRPIVLEKNSLDVANSTLPFHVYVKQYVGTVGYVTLFWTRYLKKTLQVKAINGMRVIFKKSNLLR